MNRLISITLSIILLLSGVATIISCSGASEEIKELSKVEVTEYEGRNLSSIEDFRENSIAGSQEVEIEDYELKVIGQIENPTSYSYEEVIDKYPSYQKVVTLNCVEGWSATILWEGFLVKDLLDDAGLLPEAKVVIFHAYDGYTTSLPIDYLLENDIMIAYKMNEVTLPPERGFPFQLVAESKWGYKWIKWITQINVSEDEDFRGFWELRGYSNSGDLDKGFFE
jgi:DMSO/TMAO reductase YedYZ molybdopterin-dependent catalytic subunit